MPRSAKVNQQYKQAVAKEWSLFSQKIKARRKELGWTQDVLAEKLECEVTTIQAYEQRRRYPSVPTLFVLCKILKLKISIE